MQFILDASWTDRLGVTNSEMGGSSRRVEWHWLHDALNHALNDPPLHTLNLDKRPLFF